MQETKRLFTAIKIHPSRNFLEVYNQIKTSLRNERITWVNNSNMHLTLKFFGETFTHQIPAIKECLEIAAASIQPFKLEIRDTGMFGSKYQPRVIWFGIESGNQLQELFQKLNEHLTQIGYQPDSQNFVPHLTLGRIKEIRDKINFQQVLNKYRSHDSGEELINELVLYESILRREGPVYIPVEAFRFNKS